MHGLVFVTWEKFLAERFGQITLTAYREALGETPANRPVTTRTYSDEQLLAGVGLASRLTGASIDVLLEGYGRYFITNGLTRHLCAYLLTQVSSGKDLLLMMGAAHAQMQRMPDGLTPPIFEYEMLPGTSTGFTLIYKSARRLCPLLSGAIQGAAERFNEKVEMVEQTCMRRGDDACRFNLLFRKGEGSSSQAAATPEQRAQEQKRQQLYKTVLQALPNNELQAITLRDLYERLAPEFQHLRLSVLVEAIYRLQYAGLAATTANQPGDTLTTRRFWRVPGN